MITEVLKETRAKIAQNGDQPSMDGAESSAVGEIDDALAVIENGGRFDLSALASLYDPSGLIQEISIRKGWSGEFLQLADRFDRANIRGGAEGVCQVPLGDVEGRFRYDRQGTS